MRLFAASLSICLCLSAQDQSWSVLRGEIPGYAETPGVTWFAELIDTAQHLLIERTPVQPGGEFEFRGAPAGPVLLRLVNSRGEAVHEQQFHTRNGFSPVIIRLPHGPRAERGEGTISLARLGHKPPSRAVKEFRRSVEARDKGRPEEAERRLRAAIAVDPAFLEAHNNLGTLLLERGRLGEAEAELRLASTLDPNSPIVLANLGVVLLHLGRVPEAENAARAAHRIDPSSIRAQYVLGLALARLGRNPDEAVHYLERASAHFPHARLALASLLEGGGKAVSARKELK